MESAPVIVPWRWYYHVPTLALCVLIVLLFYLFRRFADEQSRLILIPVVLAFILLRMEGLSVLVVLLAVVCIVIWWTVSRQTRSSIV